MPQLPSGRHVGFTIGVAREKIKANDFTAWMAFKTAVNSIEDMKSVVNIVYYKSDNESPTVDDPRLGEPYISDLVISDIGTDKCTWSEEDKSAFLEIIKIIYSLLLYRQIFTKFNWTGDTLPLH